MAFEPQVAKQQSGNDLMPGAQESEGEESKTQFTSKGTIPPPLVGNENQQSKSASDMAFGSPVDPAWSKQQADALVAARSRIQGRQMSMLFDDKVTTWFLKGSKTVMEDYGMRWEAAKTHFEDSVQKHLDAAAKRRETGNFLIGVALGGLPQTKALKVLNKFLEVKGQVEGAISALNIPSSRFGSGQKRHDGAAPAAVESGPAQAKAPDGTKVNWIPLVDQLLSSKESFNASMTGVTSVEHQYDYFIEQLRAGAISPDSEAAKRVEQLIAFDLPENMGAFASASDFYSDVDQGLSGKTQPDIEREMAMDWIAALQRDQINVLDDVNPYLTDIGVVGPRSQKGLNMDGGDTLRDNEELMLWTKARVNAEMRGLVGQHVEWLGGRRVGDMIKGSVRANGQVYAATAKAPDDAKCYVDRVVVSEHAGGSVEVKSLQNAFAMVEQTTGDAFSGINHARYGDQVRMGQFELVVAADGGNWETNGDQAHRG